MVGIPIPSGDDDEDESREFLSSAVDMMVRQAVHSCWMALPKDKRNADEIKRHLNRLIDRAMRDMEEDREAFGL